MRRCICQYDNVTITYSTSPVTLSKSGLVEDLPKFNENEFGLLTHLHVRRARTVNGRSVSTDEPCADCITEGEVSVLRLSIWHVPSSHCEMTRSRTHCTQYQRPYIFGYPLPYPRDCFLRFPTRNFTFLYLTSTCKKKKFRHSAGYRP